MTEERANAYDRCCKSISGKIVRAGGKSECGDKIDIWIVEASEKYNVKESHIRNLRIGN